MHPPLLFENIGMELIYSFVIIVCSLMIYFGTKNLYELSSYRGIKYFRQAFLFFAIAYFFRSAIKFLMILFDRAIFDFSPRFLGVVTLFLFMYFSSMAVFYLLYSVMWKRWDGSSKKIYFFHLLAFVISFLTIASRRIEFHLALNLLLLVFVGIITYTSYKNTKDRKKGRQLYTIYFLLFIFWVLNIFDIVVPSFFSTFKLLVYLVSLAIFMLILYKVLRKAGLG
ncbi:MAG: hypothetical protein ABIH63_02115 [archaeon]